MEKFLRTYCHIESETLIDMLSSLSHRELKDVLRELYKIKLSTLPFELVSPEALNNGEILMVDDAIGNPAPYRNPARIDEKQFFEDIIAHQKPTINRENEEDYENIVDTIEEYLTIENIDITCLAPFNIPKTKNISLERKR